MTKAACKAFTAEYSFEAPCGVAVKPVDGDEVCRFLTELGPGNVISVTHDQSGIFVWYWLTTPVVVEASDA